MNKPETRAAGAIALVLALALVACGDRQTAGGDAGQGSDSARPSGVDGGGGGEGYEFTFCEKGEVHTTRCEGGICDPMPFVVCADGSCVHEPATCEATEQPKIAVTIRNGGSETVYLDGLASRPFSIERKSDGAVFEASSLMARGPCDTCDQLCADNMHGDPAPCYLELAAGAELELSWNGELRAERQCEPCGALCYEATPIAPGDHGFVVAYRKALDQPGYDFKPIDCSVNKGLPSWMGDGIGLPELDQQAEIVVSYDGQTELLLEIK